MALTYKGRLPGVICEAALPPTGEGPLRLDVAAFVGFAERGPLNTPVALEDISQYRAVFGGDLLVARDDGRPVYAHLPEAVAAFFDNGGRRCYAVRVAGADARPNRFRLPGLVAWQPEQGGDGLRTVVAPAAWVGRWSDALSVGTQVRFRPLRTTAFRPAVAPALLEVDLETPTATTVIAGDLLRVRFGGPGDPLLLVPVAQVQVRGPAVASTRGVPITASAAGAQTLAFTSSLAILPTPLLTVEQFGVEGWVVLGAPESDLETSRGASGWEYTLRLRSAATIRPGDLLRLTGGDGVTLRFPVARVERSESSPPGSVELRITSRAPLPQPVQAERLDEQGWTALPAPLLDPTARGIASGDYALDLPGDAVVAVGDLLRVTCADGSVLLFPVAGVSRLQPEESPPAAPFLHVVGQAPLWQTAAAPAGMPEQVDRLSFDLLVREVRDDASALESWRERRFLPGPGYWADALARWSDDAPAGPPDLPADRSSRLRAPAEALAAPPLYLPLGMTDLLTDDGFVGALPDPLEAGKDGLDRFDPVALFLDVDLRTTTVGNLAREAERLLYLDATPRRLTKAHSVWPIDEVGLVAIPDLVHRAWPDERAPMMIPPPPPEPEPEPEPIDWSQFQNCPQPPPPASNTAVEVVRQFYRAFLAGADAAARSYLADDLRAELADTALADVLGVDTPVESFSATPPPCAADTVTLRGVLRLATGVALVNLFTLERSGTIWVITAIAAPTRTRAPADIQRQLALLPPAQRPADYVADDLLAVQRALIRLCAARGDLLALLSLPEHFQQRDTLDWQQQVTSGGELRDSAALSYAAAYHPWLLGREERTPELGLLRATPPDGAAGGMIAARELARGVWVAPANVALRGVVGLSPALSEAEQIALFDAQLNLMRQTPGQFAAASAHTLSPDRLLVQVSVRRLLILLRKLALRRGMRYVFEPNNERFRQQVRIAFERVLERLAERGALSAFEVTTGEGLNTQNDIDNGRFLIAIKVAPTQPIEFITIVMLRSGEGLLQTFER